MQMASTSAGRRPNRQRVQVTDTQRELPLAAVAGLLMAIALEAIPVPFGVAIAGVQLVRVLRAPQGGPAASQ